MPWEIIGIVSIIVFTFGTIFLARGFANKMTSTSDEDIETINRLQATGGKARATLTTIQPTGLTVNNFNVQCNVGFWLDPVDGTEAFEGTKKMFFLETQFPNQGDIWPAWYDLFDHTVFAVASPVKLDPAQIPIYREFGIKHPLDPDWEPTD
jgi:hypothetical protein